MFDQGQEARSAANLGSGATDAKSEDAEAQSNSSVSCTTDAPHSRSAATPRADQPPPPRPEKRLPKDQDGFARGERQEQEEWAREQETGVFPCFMPCGQAACRKLGCVRVYNARHAND